MKAEVALSAADEGVLQLIAYQTPNPMKTFYAAYGLGVDSATNWNRLSRGSTDPDGGDPDQGGDTASRRNGQQACAASSSRRRSGRRCWSPTSTARRASRSPRPTTSTAFRLMAVAADAGDRFGAGDRRLTVDEAADGGAGAAALPRARRPRRRRRHHPQHDRAAPARRRSPRPRPASRSTARPRRRSRCPRTARSRVRFPVHAGGDAASATFELRRRDGQREGRGRGHAADRQAARDRRRARSSSRTLGAAAWSGSLGIGSDVVRADSKLAITRRPHRRRRARAEPARRSSSTRTAASSRRCRGSCRCRGEGPRELARRSARSARARGRGVHPAPASRR